MTRRKQLARARGLFLSELKKQSPDLEDDWLPYLLAFGLDKRVDRWFAAYGAEPANHLNTETLRTGSAGSYSPVGSSWTGGGGAFGGAGATAAWTAAAGGIAAGVNRPGSGGSSGGSSGGGSSSGGGGGGGW